MKYKRKIINTMKKSVLLMAAVAAIASCTQKEIESPSLTRQVTIVANTVDTRTQLSGNEVQWEAGDAVKLRFTSLTTDQPYYITTFNNTSGAVASATFTGTLPNTVSMDNYEATGYAVYPTGAMNADGNVVFTLPAEQNPGTDGSFESGLNLSSATVSLADLENNGTASANFKNALSVIRFTVDADVQSVKIEADQPLAGQANMSFVTSGDDAGRLQVSDFVSSSNSVTFTPASGAAFDASTKYNVLVYPGTYSFLKVTLTDTDGCVYTKENSGSFTFAASKFYTFNFNTQYEKAYSFTATGRNFVEGNAIATVFSDADGKVIHEAELTADASLKFAGKLPKAVVHGENITGFAIYPSTSYDRTQDKVTYTLPSDGKDGAELYSASLSATSTSVAFNSVSDALSTLSFTVPEGVSSVKIVSDKGFVGTAEMTVNSNGKLVSGAGDGKEIKMSSVSAQTYNLRIYPVSGATLTFTLTDASGKTVTLDPLTNVNAEAGVPYNALLDSDIKFEKGGSFDNEDFTDGGSHDF